LPVPSRARLQEFVAAILDAIARHDILRTSILWEGLPHPVQVVYRKAELHVDVTTLQAVQGAVERIEDLMPANGRMDLRLAPLLRLRVSKAPHGDEWRILLTVHHVTCDQITMEALITEVVSR